MKYLIKLALKLIPRHYLHRISHFFLIIVSPFYRGNNYEDPINGIKYRKLLPYGRRNPRKNALAPDSMSLERHRAFYLYLKEKTDFFSSNLRILHIAPEYCFLKKFKKIDNIEYITGDLNSPWADVKMDVHEIPFEDNSFDVIFANHLLEHVENDLEVMKEFYRVMKPKGWGIFQVPIDRNRETTYENPAITSPKEREKHFWQSDHLRLYGKDYANRLASVGFKVIEDDFIQSLSENQIKRYCLPENEIIYYCSKPEN